MFFLLKKTYPIISLILLFLGPYFFFQTLQFLQHLDYVAALLSLLAGWFLLRAAIDLIRTFLVYEMEKLHPSPPPPKTPETTSPKSLPSEAEID